MLYGCIGEKLGHSFSKEIHNMIGSYVYELKEIARDDLDAFMRQGDFLGINVTIPYKEKVIPHLAYIDESAKAVERMLTIMGDAMVGGNLIRHNGFTILKKKAAG